MEQLLQSDAISVPMLKPGTWVRRPVRKEDFKKSPIKGARIEHHFIYIHHLLSIGYDGTKVALEHHSKQVSKPVKEAIGTSGAAVIGALDGVSAIPVAVAPVAPAATLLGSATLGGWAVNLGLMSQPVAAAAVATSIGAIVFPVVIGAIGVGATGLALMKTYHYLRGDSYKKVKIKNMGNGMMKEKDYIAKMIEKGIEKIQKDEDIDIDEDMLCELLDDLFKILEKYWFAK